MTPPTRAEVLSLLAGLPPHEASIACYRGNLWAVTAYLALEAEPAKLVHDGDRVSLILGGGLPSDWVGWDDIADLCATIGSYQTQRNNIARGAAGTP